MTVFNVMYVCYIAKIRLYIIHSHFLLSVFLHGNQKWNFFGDFLQISLPCTGLHVTVSTVHQYPFIQRKNVCCKFKMDVFLSDILWQKYFTNEKMRTTVSVFIHVPIGRVQSTCRTNLCALLFSVSVLGSYYGMHSSPQCLKVLCRYVHVGTCSFGYDLLGMFTVEINVIIPSAGSC